MMHGGKFLDGEFEEMIEDAYNEFGGADDERVLRAYHELTEGYRFTLTEVKDTYRGEWNGTLEDWWIEKELPEHVGNETLKLLEANFIVLDSDAVDSIALEQEYAVVDGFVFSLNV